jgi:Uma2 family endonuclease
LLTELNNALRALGSGLEALAEPSTRLSDYDLPEPDVVLTRYRGDGPVPRESVALLIEVAHTSQAMDKGLKLTRYAMAGVPEYWLADVEEMVIHQYTSPTAGEYADCRSQPIGERIAAKTVPGLEVPTDLLG